MNDRELIDKLGGPAKVAAALGFDLKKGGVQRVHNWRSRGIPPRVKLEHAAVFQSPQAVEAGKTAITTTEETRDAA